MDVAASLALSSDEARLAALETFDVLDTPSEEGFDRITRLACRLFAVPMSTVTFIDGHRQWFKSRQGVETPETDKGPALCNYAIRQTEPLVIPDTMADERFKDNPLVLAGPRIRFYAGVPLRTGAGHAIGTLCIMDARPRAFSPQDTETLRDLGKLVMDVLELRIQADTDALTGALSRRAFRREGGRALALARRHRHEVSCLMVDLDHFKAINDTHGHALGDQVLRACAETCRGVLRGSDLFGRMGGEEFAVLLPHTGASGALETAEKLRLAIAAVRVGGVVDPIGVTASFGCASLDRTVEDVDTLLDRADAALYGAKRDGRDRVQPWQPPAQQLEPNRRRRVLKAGRIFFNAGRSTIDSTVRSLSEQGAGLDVISSAGIPDEFKLQIAADGWSRLCRITSKLDKHLEVDFV